MLTNEFILLCQSYAKKRDDVLSENIADSRKLCKYSVEFYSYVLEFRYVKKESALVKPSSLYCVLKLRKNSTVHYHLTDIIPFLKEKTFKSCYFWNIESVERLESCFKCLEEILEKILLQITPFLFDDSVLRNSLFQSYKTIYNLKPNDIDFEKIDNTDDFAHNFFVSLQKTRDQYIFSRYSNFKPYSLLVKGNVEKALRQYEKLKCKDRLSEYEKALTEHISGLENRDFKAFDPSCDTSACDKLLSPLSGLKAFIICFIISSLFFCGLFALWNFICSADTTVLLSAPWYIGFLCSGLCAIFGAMAFITYIPNKNLTKIERKNFSNVLVSRIMKKVSFVLFAFSVCVSLFFAVMIMTSNVRFYEESIRFDNRSYGYEQIDAVYRIDARYNIYGERINRPSYVILFKDKTSLDLDGYTTTEFTEKKVLPLLEVKGFEVDFADSEKDLPWYSE